MKIIQLLNKNKVRIIKLLVNFLSDEQYLKLMFKTKVGYALNLDNPRTYNGKLQWLKLNDRHTGYTQMVDKVEAKKYVSSIIGDKYIIKTLGVWNSVNDIDWDSLPSQFVIKVTSDSGGIVVCKDKSHLDIQEAKKILLNGWGKNYYKYNKEYPYRDLTPRIIAEEYKEDDSGELKDYKFFCFDGEPKALFVASDRQKKNEETKFDFYDLDWNHLPFTNGHPNNPQGNEKPKNFGEMIEVARKLSQGIPHVRVDLYNIKGEIYFGELTFFHWGGMKPFVPEQWDYTFGEWISLPAKK